MNKLWLIALLLPITAMGPDDPVKTKIGEGITVMLPSELKPMAPEDVAQRYPSVRAPLGAFTNGDRDVDFSVNISATQWPDENLDIAKKFFKAGIYNLYDRIDMIGEGIHEVNKKKFIYFEFISRLNGSKMIEGTQPPMFRYIFIQYRIEQGRTLVFTFNCPQDQKEFWQARALALMKSVRIK
jgi:hypothetical protein